MSGGFFDTVGDLIQHPLEQTYNTSVESVTGGYDFLSDLAHGDYNNAYDSLDNSWDYNNNQLSGILQDDLGLAHNEVTNNPYDTGLVALALYFGGEAAFGGDTAGAGGASGGGGLDLSSVLGPDAFGDGAASGSTSGLDLSSVLGSDAFGSGASTTSTTGGLDLSSVLGSDAFSGGAGEAGGGSWLDTVGDWYDTYKEYSQYKDLADQVLGGGSDAAPAAAASAVGSTNKHETYSDLLRRLYTINPYDKIKLANGKEF